MDQAAVCSKVVVLLLLIQCCLLVPLMGSMFVALFCVLSSSFCIHINGEERAVCFTLFIFLVSCDCYCSMALPQGTMGWSAVCDFGIY